MKDSTCLILRLVWKIKLSNPHDTNHVHSVVASFIRTTKISEIIFRKMATSEETLKL